MLGKLVWKGPLGRFGCVGRRGASEFSPGELVGRVGVVGVPFGKGQKEKGKYEAGLKAAPDLIRSTGFMDALNAIGVEVCDYGDVQYEPQIGLAAKNMHNLEHVAPCAKAVSEAVECVLGEKRSCLVLGGDHTIGIGSIHGHLKVADPGKVALLYVDAHPDINTSLTSPSGNIHGMAVAMLCGELEASWRQAGLRGMEWMTSRLVLPNLAYIAVRSVDQGEAKFLTDNNVLVFGMDDIDRLGMRGVIQAALEKVDPNADRSIHVSFDIDSVDPLESPSTTVPVRGGLTLREAICLAECLYKTKRVSVVDVVEINPMIGCGDLTLEAINHVLMAMYGHNRKGNGPKEEHAKTKICD